ncbi:hypothetical protein PENTCL1PPCAC_29570, partial [Pristionchus entomophagus]
DRSGMNDEGTATASSGSYICDLADPCLERIAHYLISKQSSKDIVEFAMSCRKYKSVVDVVMAKDSNRPPILRLEYTNLAENAVDNDYYYTIVASNRHEMYQNFDTLRPFVRYTERPLPGETRFILRRKVYTNDECSRISQVIPSVLRIYGEIRPALDIDNISSFIGNASVDEFEINTQFFDEVHKDALLRFYNQRKGRHVSISSNILWDIKDLGLSIIRLLEHVDVTLYLRNVINGVPRIKWKEIFERVSGMGVKVEVDGNEWPNDNLDSNREKVVCFSMPNR